MAEGQVDKGLQELKRAVQEAPGNLEYRTTYYRQRDLQLGGLLAQADAARQLGRLAEADADYRRALEIDRTNERARAGLIATEIERRHRLRLDDAETKFKAGQLDAAENVVRSILDENPRQKEAQVFKRRLAERAMLADETPTALKDSLAHPVTMDFREAPIRSVFDFLARTAGINFIFDKEVRSDTRVTLYVKNTSVEDAIRTILITNQLEDKILNDNTVLIYPANTGKTKDYKDLVVKSFYLTNVDAKQMANTIKTLVKTKDLIVDEKLNYLAMRDTPEAIRMAERLIANQDIADPEVILEVEVLEVSANRLLELGIRYPEQLGYGVSGVDATPGTLRLDEWRSRDSSLVRMTIGNPALLFSLRNTDSDTNLLANPRIRVKSKEKAKVHIGERVPVITTISTANVGVSDSVNYLDVGLKLEVEPTVSLDDEVSIKVGLEVSNILETIVRTSGLQTYRLGTRMANTTLRLKDAETQVLAGLIQDDERKSANKVPGLGDIPLLGRLFSSHSDSKTKTEIVLLITPRIVRNLNIGEVGNSTFLSGTESVVGVPPLRMKTVDTGPSNAAISTAAGAAGQAQGPSPAATADQKTDPPTNPPLASPGFAPGPALPQGVPQLPPPPPRQSGAMPAPAASSLPADDDPRRTQNRPPDAGAKR